MNFENVVFRRLFSVNMRKKLRISLAEMSFENDFTVTERGNLYPAVTLMPYTAEKIENGIYHVNGGCLRRLICEHFPFAEYKINLIRLSGKAGISFLNTFSGNCVDVYVESSPNGFSVCFSTNGCIYAGGLSFPVTAQSVSFGTRGREIDVYYEINGHRNFAGSIDVPALEDSCSCPFPFKALLYCEAEVFETDEILSYIDNGLALADMKPVRYIDGSTFICAGRVYFTMSSRLGSGGYQSVISWLPGTCEFRLEGAVFFDIGAKGKISGDVASCVLYDREKEEFLIWMCAFSNGHILGCGKTAGDILHGISVVDVTLMEKKEGSTETEFYALEGDEDPDFYYDREKKKWFLSVCRVRKFGERNTYSYVKFESDEPLAGYKYYGATCKTGETGGMTVEIDGKKYFMCGAEMSEISKYRIYDAETLELLTEAEYDYPDGGFRGWGTLLPVNAGNRHRVFQLTFDRVLSSDFNWSYGNLYVFEAVEFPQKQRI